MFVKERRSKRRKSLPDIKMMIKSVRKNERTKAKHLGKMELIIFNQAKLLVLICQKDNYLK